MRYRSWSRAALLLGALVPAAALASACGGSSTQGNTAATSMSTAASSPTVAAAAEHDATVRAIEESGDPRMAWKFDPVQVAIVAGGRVVFTNAGKEAHTATADDGSFDAGTLNPNETRTVTFDRAGSFGYHCSLHPWMKGKIVVTSNG